MAWRVWDLLAPVKQLWSSLTSSQRRRIVLASLFALSLAARDLVLLFVAGSLFALSELSPPATPRPSLPRPG